MSNGLTKGCQPDNRLLRRSASYHYSGICVSSRAVRGEKSMLRLPNINAYAYLARTSIENAGSLDVTMQSDWWNPVRSWCLDCLTEQVRRPPLPYHSLYAAKIDQELPKAMIFLGLFGLDERSASRPDAQNLDGAAIGFTNLTSLHEYTDSMYLQIEGSRCCQEGK